MNQITRFQPTRPVSARTSQSLQQQPSAPVFSAANPLPQSPVSDLTPAQWQGQFIQFGAASAKAPADIPKIEAAFAHCTPLTYRLAKTIDGGSVGKVEMYEFTDPNRPEAKPQQVFVLEKPELEIATLGSTVPYGSADEHDPSLHGFFHFLEHLFFKGTGDGKGNIVLAPQEFDKRVAKTYAGINAMTGEEMTLYFIQNTRKADVLDNMKRHLLFIQDPALVAKEVASESKTVCNEIGQYLNRLNVRLNYQAMEDMFGPNPYSHPILGTRESVSNMSADTIRQMFNRFYGQSHRKFLAVGGMDKKAVLETFAKCGNLEPQRFEEDYTPPARPAIPERTDVLRRTYYEKGYPPEKGMISWCFQGPGQTPGNLKEYMAWEMLNAIATGSRTSMADLEMVNRDHVADYVASGINTLREASVWQIKAQCDTAQVEKMEGRLEEILERLRTGNIPAEDFELARNCMLKSHADSMEDPNDIFFTLVPLVNEGLEDQLFGDKFKQVLESITPADVQAVAEKYLVPGRKLAYRVLSDTHQPAEKPAPAAGPVKFGGRLESYEKSSRLTGGAELIVDDRPGRAKTSMTIAVPGGNRMGKYPGELKLLTHLLRRSNHQQPVNDLAKFEVNKRLDFSIKAENDYLVLQVTGEPEKLGDMVTLLRNTLLHPTYSKEDVAREKDVLMGSYAAAMSDIPGMAAEIGNLEGFYPKNHPYGQKITGSSQLNGPPGLNFTRQMVGKTQAKLTPKRMHGLHHQIFRPEQMIVSVVGNITGVENFDLKEHLNDLMRGLEKTAAKQPVKLRPVPNPTLPQNLIDVKIKEGKLDHTQIVRSWPTSGLNDKDRAAMILLSGILYDVGMTSRLFQTFREGPHGGLCYHTHGLHLPQKEGGRFKWYIGTEHKDVSLVMDLIDQVMNGLVHPEAIGKTAEALEEELEDVKGKLKYDYGVAAAKAEAKSQSNALHRALDIPSPLELHEQFDNITVADLQAVAEKYFTKPSLTTILTTKETAKEIGLKPNARMTREEWLKTDEWLKTRPAKPPAENPPAPQDGSARES